MQFLTYLTLIGAASAYDKEDFKADSSKLQKIADGFD
jgi:hypothetical protein